MQVLILILKQVDLMNDILHELAEAGIKGGTIVDAKGMGESLLSMEDIPMFGAIRQLLSHEEKEDFYQNWCRSYGDRHALHFHDQCIGGDSSGCYDRHHKDSFS